MAAASTPRQLLGGPSQICIAVADLDAAVRLWWHEYGVGPWRIWDLDSTRLNKQFVGDEAVDYGMRIAIADWGPVEFELVQPLDDRSIYAQSLAARGGKPHVHHLFCPTDNYDAALEHHRARGTGPIQSGGYRDGRFAYLGTEGEAGVVLEIGAEPPGWELPPPDAVYPPD